jgi:hypothetical protein
MRSNDLANIKNLAIMSVMIAAMPKDTQCRSWDARIKTADTLTTCAMSANDDHRNQSLDRAVEIPTDRPSTDAEQVASRRHPAW